MSEKKDDESVLDYLLKLAHLQRILDERERAKHPQPDKHEEPAEVIHESPSTHVTTVLTMIPEKERGRQGSYTFGKNQGSQIFRLGSQSCGTFRTNWKMGGE